MKIQIVIDTFKNVLKDYELAHKNKFYIVTFICNHAFYKYNVQLQSLFSKTGYYKNYVDHSALEIPFNVLISNKLTLKWKISFLKKEIKSLKSLQKKGYTHI